jgi:hypothetical protein
VEGAESAQLIQASTRFVPHVAVLLVFTAAIALLQGGGRRDLEDCANPAALLPNGDPSPRASDANAEKRRTSRQRAVGERGRWTEGTTTTPEDFRLEYAVLHSYEPRRIYHQPGRNLVSEARSRTDELEWVRDGDRELPIHRLRFERSTRSAGPEVVAAYLIVYHGEPVTNPYRAHLAAAVPELWSGRRPMTLYLASVRAPAARRAQAEAATQRWLLERWQNHREACTAP